MSDFAKTLKETIESRNLSQKWLADAADTKEATISRYVTGVNKSPNVDILINISKALNVSTDYLLGLTDIPQHKPDMSAEERVLLSAFRRASERDKGIIRSVLDTYLAPNERGFVQPAKQDESKIK